MEMTTAMRASPIRRAVQSGLRWGLYGFVAGITLAEMARVVLGEWLDEPPTPAPPPDDSPAGPPPVWIST